MVSSTSPVTEKIWAVLRPLRYCPGNSDGQTQELIEGKLSGPVSGTDGYEKYEGTFSVLPEAYKVTVYAMNFDETGEPNISLPVETKV